MGEIMNQNSEQWAMLSPLVLLRTTWIRFILIASIVFIRRGKAARYVFLSIILQFLVVIVAFHVTQNVHLIGIAHLLFWPPIIYYILKFERKSEKFEFSSIYGIWIGLLITTMSVSLIFDIREVILFSMGIDRIA